MRSTRNLPAVAVLGLLVLAPAPAMAHDAARGAPAPLLRIGDVTACPGDPIRVDRAIVGEFDTTREGGYVLVPFEVPAGTTSVRVKYCFDQPENPVTAATLKHTIDMGIYDARGAPGALWGEREFRGWGGSSHPDVTITPQGFSTEQQYKERPKGHVPGRTTRGYEPGPIPAGTWAAELGVAAVVSQAEGDADGKVAWRVEVELSNDPAFAAAPYKPAAYDERPAQPKPGWYAGDLHVHAEHSALGDATMTETFEYAFGPAKLDFVTLSDYVTDSAWGEIGRYQGARKGKLITRSSEVITYRGHTNNHSSVDYVDYRTGPIWEYGADGSLTAKRDPRPPSDILDAVHRGGGWTQVNHPTIFPSETPGFANLCRGCPWDYSDAETKWERVDAYEVHTGPPGFSAAPGGPLVGPNPFTLTAIGEWDSLRARGFPVTAVAVSDSHNAGRTSGPTQSPVGDGTTVVYADELSEDGVRRAVQAGHAYVKLLGADSPDLRFEADSGDRVAIMGDRLPGARAEFTAVVRGGDGMTLVILRDGERIDSVTVEGDSFQHEFTATRKGQYRLQVEQGTVIHSLTNPISFGSDPRPAPAGVRAGGKPAALRLSASPKRLRAGKATKTRFTIRSNGGAPLGGILVRAGGRSAYTDSRGIAWLTLKPGTTVKRLRVTASATRWKSAKRNVSVRR